jgi:hypothetical protein
MTITEDLIEWIKTQPIGKNKEVDMAKGLHKYPHTLSDFIKFVRFTIKYSGKNAQ